MTDTTKLREELAAEITKHAENSGGAKEMADDLMPWLTALIERREAEAHLAHCQYCARRYKFETELRHFVKVTASAPMDPALKQKLAALRTPLE